MASDMKALLGKLRKLRVNRDDPYWEVGSFAVTPGGGCVPLSEVPEAKFVLCVSEQQHVGVFPVIDDCSQYEAFLRALAACAFGFGDLSDHPPNFLPPQIHIGAASAAVREELQAALSPLGVRVEVKPQLPLVSELSAVMMEMVSGRATVDSAEPGGLLSVPGMTAERVRAFAHGAREFFGARPWKLVPGEVLWEIVGAPDDCQARFFTVMGALGESTGLAMFRTETMHDLMAQAHDPEGFFATTADTYWSVCFDDPDSAPLQDVETWDAQGFGYLGREQLIPVAMGIGQQMKSVRPTPELLTWMEGCLRAAAQLKRSHFLRGEGTFQVITFDGPRQLVLRAVPEC